MRTCKDMVSLNVFAAVQRDKVMAQKFLAASDRKAADSKIEQLSNDSRVEAAYDALYNLSAAVLACVGFRAICNDSHHILVLEAVCAEIGASNELFQKVDALRKIRNLKYNGATRSYADYKVAASLLDEFSNLVKVWMAANLAKLF